MILLLEGINAASIIIIIIIIIINNNMKTKISQTSDKVTKEVTSLALQLDESLTYVRRNYNE